MKARGPWWGWVWVVRRIGQRLDRIGTALEAQNQLLARLADEWAPRPDALPVDPTSTSVEFVDAAEQAAVLAYIQRTTLDVGRPPTDDEVIAFLADEATQALHRRDPR